MLFKITLTQPTQPVNVNNQHEMNSFIHRCIGKGNKYHDTFSSYNISNLQGGTLNGDKKTLSFHNEPYFMVSSMDEDFLNTFVSGITTKGQEVFGMKFKQLEPMKPYLHKFYDKVVTISPILLKDNNGRKINIKDNNWIERLHDQCVKKLAHVGIQDSTFKIEFFKKEKSHTKMVMVGDVFNPCSMVGLKVYGKIATRRALYNMGFGNSTGSGFGMVKIYE